jgi:hypothetical protein
MCIKNFLNKTEDLSNKLDNFDNKKSNYVKSDSVCS